jgi:hypothetical protein
MVVVGAAALIIFAAGILVGHFALPRSGGSGSSLPPPVAVQPGSGSPVSNLGATVTLTGRDGAELAVTLQKVLTHVATSGGQVLEIDLRLASVGRTTEKVRPGAQVLVLDASGHAYSPGGTRASVNCRNFGLASVTLSKTQTVSGCVLVQVPESVTATRAEFVPSGAHFSSSGTAAIWRLR